MLGKKKRVVPSWEAKGALPGPGPKRMPPPPPRPLRADPAAKVCPLRGMAPCVLECAWHTGEVCALRHIAVETYFIADALRGLAGPAALGKGAASKEMEVIDCNL